MWQLTMYCHLRSPVVMCHNYQKVLGPRIPASDLISMASFTFTMRRHLFRLASAPFTSWRLAKFGWVPFAMYNTWSAWKRSRTQSLRRVGEISGSILTCFWTKEVHEILRQCRKHFVLSRFLARLPKLMSRFVRKIFTMKSSKTDLLSTPFGKVRLSSVCWSLRNLVMNYK